MEVLVEGERREREEKERLQVVWVGGGGFPGVVICTPCAWILPLGRMSPFVQYNT